MIFLESPLRDAAWNLALEEYVFYSMPKEQEYLMLWQNDCSVIIGKHQNAVQEVNLPFIEEQHIPVIRRLSGGGAVYHDAGNLNFTYVVNGTDPEILSERLIEPLLLACRRFGISAEVSGRNDILANGKKFSGNSGYQENGRIMHHGTILINADLEKMSRSLQVSPDKFRSKGIQSVRARVGNLSEWVPDGLSVQAFAEALKEEAGHVYPQMKSYVWTPEDLQNVQKLCEEKYRTWEWNYGNFPVYQVERSRRIEGCGTVSVYMNVTAGRITELALCGDFLGKGDTDVLADAFLDCPLRLDPILERLESLSLETYIKGMRLEIFAEMLLGI